MAHTGRAPSEPLTVQGSEDLLALGWSRARYGRGRRFGLGVTSWRLRYSVQRATPRGGFRRLPNPPRQLLGRHDQSVSCFRVDSGGSPAAGGGSPTLSPSRGVETRGGFLDVIPTLAISSRWRRQLDNCDEYKPSRRRRAATSPSRHRPHALSGLYSAVKRRRFACRSLPDPGPPPHRGRRDLQSPYGLPPRRRLSLYQHTHALILLHPLH